MIDSPSESSLVCACTHMCVCAFMCYSVCDGVHSKEYMVTEFLIMFKYAATNLIITFVSCMYKCVNSLFIFIKRLLHERKYWKHKINDLSTFSSGIRINN